MTNFDFLQTEFPSIFQEASDAEKHAITAPRYCALLCRTALEKTVHWLYENDTDLQQPYDTKLASLIHEQCFRDMLKPSMFREIDAIRLAGNNAAHGKSVSRNEAITSLKYLFCFLSFVSHYYSEADPFIPPFDDSLIPDGKENDKSKKELQTVAESLLKQTEQLKEERKKRKNRLNKLNCYSYKSTSKTKLLPNVKLNEKQALTKIKPFLNSFRNRPHAKYTSIFYSKKPVGITFAKGTNWNTK